LIGRLCDSQLSARIIENRTLTGEQNESVNRVQLFRPEVDLDVIPQMYRKIGPFFLGCAKPILKAFWFRTTMLDRTSF
jgi:hypothetical protein